MKRPASNLIRASYAACVKRSACATRPGLSRLSACSRNDDLQNKWLMSCRTAAVTSGSLRWRDSMQCTVPCEATFCAKVSSLIVSANTLTSLVLASWPDGCAKGSGWMERSCASALAISSKYCDPAVLVASSLSIENDVWRPLMLTTLSGACACIIMSGGGCMGVRSAVKSMIGALGDGCGGGSGAGTCAGQNPGGMVECGGLVMMTPSAGGPAAASITPSDG
mmetsp:Transcript_36791/g.105440  ORF Transcript_36791/g.105440 Transcript_36791/m.105440 type:complete len:223 (-) Transcript_36791:204-872(-)